MNPRKLLSPAFFLTCLASLTALAHQASSQSSVPPQVVSAVAPIYSPVAVAARAQGEVIVEVKVNQAGEVSAATAMTGHPILRRATEAAARLWKFEPAEEKSGTRAARLSFVFQFSDGGTFDADATPVFMPPYKVVVTHKEPPHIDYIHRPGGKFSNNDR